MYVHIAFVYIMQIKSIYFPPSIAKLQTILASKAVLNTQKQQTQILIQTFAIHRNLLNQVRN